MPSNPTPRAYLLRETVLLLGFTYMIIFGGNGGGLLSRPAFMINCSILTLLAAGWVIARRRSQAQLQHAGQVQPTTQTQSASAPWLALAAAVFLLTQVAAALAGIDPSRSLPEVWLYGIEIFIVVMVYSAVRRGWPAELFIKTLLIVGVVVSLFAWSDALRWYLGWLQASGVPDSISGWIPAVSYRLPAPNMLAVLFNMLLMACLARLLAVRRTGVRLALGLYALSSLALIFLTSSRSGWIGTAAGLFTLALLNLGTLRKWLVFLLRFLKKHPWLWLVLAALVLGGLAVGGTLLYRQAVQPTHGPLLTSRSEFWPRSWNAFKSSPFLGIGPFTFTSLFAGANSVPPSLLFAFSHNLYLDVLYGSGLAGLAAFLLLAALLLMRLLKNLRVTGASGTTDPAHRAVVVGVLAALAAFGVHSLFDSLYHTEPVVAMTLAVLLGAACALHSQTVLTSPNFRFLKIGGGRRGLGKSSTSPKIRFLDFGGGRRGLGLSLTIALSVLVAGYGWFHLWQVWPFFDAADAANAANWPAAVDGYRLAAQRNPGMAAAHHQLGLSLWMLSQSDAADPALLEEALQSLQKTVELDPYYALHWSNLSQLYRLAGDNAQALAAAQTAADRAPASALFQLLLANTAGQAGDAELSGRACRAALDLDARITAHPAWQDTPACLTAFTGWQAANPPGAPLDLPELEAALQGSPDSPVAYLVLAQALLERGDTARAAAVLGQAHSVFMVETQDYLDLLVMDARLQRALGNTQAAADLEQQIQESYAGWSVYGPGSLGLRLYAAAAYRVPAMQLEMVTP